MDEMGAYYPPPPPPPPPQPSSYPYYPPPPPPPPPPQYYPPHHYHPQQSYEYEHHYPHQSYIPSYSQPAPPPQGFYDDLKTLFVAGLPSDVKPRELYNLFREFPGYQSSQLRGASEKNQPYGFAVFKDQHCAVAAMQALNGMMFDLTKPSTLYINLAKSNSRSKRSRPDDGGYGLSDKRVKGSDAFSRALPHSGLGSNMHMPGMTNSAHNMIGYSSAESDGFDTGALSATETVRMNTLAPYVPRNNTPCPTLFVANLGPTCTEQELNQVFSRCPGFLKLKMQNKNGAPVAFVDFQDIASSTGALVNLQDCILHSSTGEGMRLEYAKSRMGMRKKSS